MKLWETESGKFVRSFERQESFVTSLAFSQDGNYIVSGSYDKTIKLWETESGQLVRTFDLERDDGITKIIVAFSPDGKYIVSGSGNFLKQWGL